MTDMSNLNAAAIPAAVSKVSVRRFVTDLAERAIKTAAQTALATFGGAGVNIWHIGWHESLGITLGATLVSVLTSLSSVGATGTASLVK